MGSYKPCTYPHPPTLTHTQPKKATHTYPNPAKDRPYPPISSRKSMEKKVFHYLLVNQIYQKLEKS